MRQEMYDEMKKDIELCRKHNDIEGSQALVEQMIAKYSSYNKEFSKDIQYTRKATVPGYPCDYRREVKNIVAKLQSYILTDPVEIEQQNDEDILLRIFSNFIEASEILQNRQRNKNPFAIEDEYDVQDLMHAYLTLYFDDVRCEEWTPSFAGAAARQDFILKKQQMVIETKMTRESMTDMRLGEEIIVDAEKYFTHPDCKKVYVFVYDKSHQIKNYKAIKNDIEQKHKNVYVYFTR